MWNLRKNLKMKFKSILKCPMCDELFCFPEINRMIERCVNSKGDVEFNCKSCNWPFSVKKNVIFEKEKSDEGN